MRALPLAAVCLLLGVAAVDDAAAEPSLKEAKAALESARSNLTAAVKRIEKDPPSTSDLEAAMGAVAALKSAIDSGAELEPKDLDYAKAALAARKELRTHRGYVEQRRAKIHIHNSRREIDGALAKLTDAIVRVEAKQASAADFDTARAAAAVLEKAVGTGEPFAGQDASFAGYLSEVKETLARHKKTIDDRSTGVAVERQRASIEEARRAVSAAMGAIPSKQATDAQFEAAERAIAQLTKVLEQGKPLEAKDSPYRSFADLARGQATEARKIIDASWSETGLSRLKAEIEPARKDLVDAGRALAGKLPTADQLAEARTAAIVVRKLLEKFQHHATRSAAFAQYVTEVKKSLLEIEVDLQKRSVAPALDAVSAAIKALGQRNAGDDAFRAVEAAIAEAKKVLARGEALEKEDRGYGAYALDAKRKLEEIVGKTGTRRSELEVQRHRHQIDASRAELYDLLKKAGGGKLGNDRLVEIENVIEGLRRLLADGAHLKKKDPKLGDYHKDIKKRLDEISERLVARREEIAVESTKAKVEPGLKELNRAMSAIEGLGPKGAAIEAAEKALAAVEAALADSASLETTLRAYGTWARDAKKNVAQAKTRLAKRKLELAGSDGRSQLEPLVDVAKSRLENAKHPGSTDADVQAAAQAVTSVKDTLERNAGLAKEHRGYGDYAARVRNDLERYVMELESAKAARAFRKATLDLYASGLAAVVASGAAKELRAQKEKLEKAVADFKSCGRAAESMLEENPALATIAVLIEGLPRKPKDLIATCSERLGAAEQELKKVAGLVAFDDGPKKAYEKAKGLLAQASKGEALTQFEECISSGKVLQHRNPELKERKFEVGGASMTLAELVEACTGEAKKLRGK